MMRRPLVRALARPLAHALAAAYGPRRRDAAIAFAFIKEALDDEIARSGWVGAARVARLCLIDIVKMRWRPAGPPITSAAVTTRPAIHQRSSAMDQLIQDVRFGLRQLRLQPAFSLVAILTMALGVGANTAIFNVAWNTMLKPLPYPHSEQLVEIWETFQTDARTNLSMPAKFQDLRREATSFQALAAYSGILAAADLTGGGDPRQLDVRRVTADYFKVFGMAPLIGRTLDATDAGDNATSIVISEQLWRDRFGAAPSILGTTLTLGGSPVRVVGVMPKAFATSGGRVDAWTPIVLPAETERKTGHYLRVVGRLADGVTIGAADAEAKAISARAAARYPDLEGKLSSFVTSLVDGRGTTRGDAEVRSGLTILSLAALVVLLIACANLASLQLARAVARAREFGIRAALGASQWRVIAQLLSEGLIISLIGAAVGILVGVWVLRQLAAVAPAEIADAAKVAPDWQVIAYAGGLAIVSAVVFALAPAWRTASGATRWLRQRADMGDRGSATMRFGLVTGQIAAAVILLIGAALLITSLARVMRVNPGFRPDGALTFDFSLPSRLDTFDQQRAWIGALTDRVGGLPGVTAVCAINEVPFNTQGGMTYVPDGETRAVGATPRTVTPGCLDALGIPVLRGRAFGANEHGGVVIVSEAFARAAWPGQDPIGRRLHMGVATGSLVEVVGVASDILSNSLETRSYPQVYQAWTSESWFGLSHMIVRAAVRPATLFPAIRSAVRGVDPDQPVAHLQTMNEVIAETTSSRRFNLTLLGSFALVALLLSAVGVYGLLSQMVAERTPEIGIRLALGATPASVVRLLLKYAAVALSIALPVGVATAVLASRLLRRFMFQVSATEPSVYAIVAIALVAIVLITAWIPARRAAHVDPAGSVRG